MLKSFLSSLKIKKCESNMNEEIVLFTYFP